MEHTVHFWHYLIMVSGFALLGALGHIGRAVFNLLPDRLTDSKEMDVLISPGYDLSDYIFDLEFDENGYYELVSLKNLRFCVITTVLGGIVCVIGVPDMNQSFAAGIDAILQYAVDLFYYRLHHFRWF